MDDFYTPAQRALQDRFGARPLADGLAAGIVAPQLAPPQIEFVEARDSFYLATVDDAGFPSVSYKGGAPGFVRALDPVTLVFPSYDGNGMFMSMGNIDATAKLGLLFVDFETPQRLRVRGEARVLHEGPVLDSYPGAQLAVQVTIESAWVNCPRYVHRMARVEASRYVPDARGEAPLPAWKRIDSIQPLLTESDQQAAASAGYITAETYAALVDAGEA